ncbi:MAG: apolipoprotein A1/A4/E family protein [Muribaculaceae bacterium]|nr:apolipoprotein A1/A4/E family protein [Muribaculaceae bacterium]
MIIIALQIFFFVKNLLRMNLFRDIFSKEKSWSLRRNNETGLVDGVYGNGNSIFDSIINSINKYLGNNSGSVIDFNLLKDAVDRHCDSVEDDIATQTPIPLYWGLAGTMAGVIIGLWDLLSSDAIKILTGSVGNNIESASNHAIGGINALLSGVAWAMVASICGIVLTTVNSLLFKRCKLEEESGKNSFLAWMQAELLPELPSDTSQALNNLVKNLNRFNKTFADNTINLRDALGAVNESYAIQANIIQAVHDMDVMKMARANVRVLQELQECTGKLEDFNRYLMDIKGYTEEIHRFEELFGRNAGRYQVLEEIRDFFRRHKEEIGKTTADADKVLQKALSELRDSAGENVEELHNNFVRQSEQFKKILNEEKEAFEEFIGQMRSQFSAQMSQMPTIARQLEEISSIPARLDKLIEKMERSNANMVKEISKAITPTPTYLPASPVDAGSGEIKYRGGGNIASAMPAWMRFSGWGALIIIALTCIFYVINSLASPRYVGGDSDLLPAPDSGLSDSVVVTEMSENITIDADSARIPEDSLIKIQNYNR